MSSRSKWLNPTPPPPPSPKIPLFPLTRRTRRKQPNSAHSRRRNPSLLHLTPAGENPSDQENEPHFVFFSSNQENPEADQRREKLEFGAEPINHELEKEKWMFQAEVLRAECNFLRMERELAFKKMDRNKVMMDKTLRSALHTLASGKKKLFEGGNVKVVLEKEIEDLSEKLVNLQKSSSIKETQFEKCINFDKKAYILQHRLEKLQELSYENCLNQDQSIHRIVFPITKNDNKSTERVIVKEDNYRCSGRCKSIISRIVEQVRADTEQWSQMQDMLGQVRCEMEQLQASRDFWENRANGSDYEIQSLKHDVEEWRGKANDYEIKANELQLELSVLQEEHRKIKEVNLGQNSNIIKTIRGPIRNQLEKKKHAFIYYKNEYEHHSYEEVCGFDENAKGETKIEENKTTRTPVKDYSSISLGKHLSNEKRMIFRRLKGKQNASEEICMQEKECVSDRRRGKMHSKRSPLRDIGNLSSS